MVKVDLITGFLGSGKTTFLLQYADYLLRQGLKIGILEYDHGAVNVDMLLLQGLRGENCELEMLSAACDADCHRRRFRTKLISMGMSGYDRVLIEPSGVFDTDEFFDALREYPLENWYEIGNVITVVDAKLEENLSREADFLLASQAASAGRILFSRCQLAAPEELERTKAHLKRAAAAIGCSRDLDGLFDTRDWATFTDADLAALSRCGYRYSDYIKLPAGEEPFSSLYYLDLPLTKAQAEARINALFSADAETKYGKILRVKGFFRDGDRWYQLNVSQSSRTLAPIPIGQHALIVIATDLQEDAINELIRG